MIEKRKQMKLITWSQVSGEEGRDKKRMVQEASFDYLDRTTRVTKSQRFGLTIASFNLIFIVIDTNNRTSRESSNFSHGSTYHLPKSEVRNF